MQLSPPPAEVKRIDLEQLRSMTAAILKSNRGPMSAQLRRTLLDTHLELANELADTESWPIDPRTLV